MHKIALFIFIGLEFSVLQGLYAQPSKASDKQVNALLAKMTLDEKVGQLNQYTGDRAATGPLSKSADKLEEIKKGHVGSMLNVRGAKDTRMVQEVAMQSRLKIPLIFGLDVIHGYRVTFPVPLAEASSWDMEAIELSARTAATEAAASGLHWTFAPMVDIFRDPRWGRVMEGAGEDPYLGSLIAKARVKGFQGKGLGNTDAVMACAKHFAAYGAAIGGRDYNAVDMSDRQLWETYLPPFKAAVDAGVATFMNSFNELNGIPATGNSYLQRNILKGKWNFQGFVVSDWSSIGEMIAHGFVENKYEAARVALTAGNDMDMESRAYTENLVQLVNDGKVPVKLVDDAVRRILRKKFELGLFDDPFRFCDEQREQAVLNSPESKKAARMVAAKSIVLLKNEKQLLPLSKSVKNIAIIGPVAKSKNDMKGAWSVYWDGKDDKDLVSLYDGIKNKVGNDVSLSYAKGCGIKDTSRNGFAEAVAVAQKADVVIMAVGESADMTGESKSKTNIHIPGVQEDLVKAIQATGKPVVVLLMAGRPTIFNWIADNVPAILYTWWLGSEAGNAMADVLFGDYNPAGKLTMSFPRSEGQIPVYYSYKNTGRPVIKEKEILYKSAYTDSPNTPRFAFGYGLSYTTFEYSNLKLSKAAIHNNETLIASFTLTNSGKYKGEEVVQLYLRDMVASVTRPVKELKDFIKISLEPGESKTLSFTIDKEKLSFYNQRMKRTTEPGRFELMIGSASNDIRLNSGFELVD
ncbi:MAG: glycoside hydrolase family 3 N-terminal domain-containing protein [Bacteroidota bacterium]|nr:glycoside hydrolase family 3 N-terminal domain-containing protein [Bacteroidota bacterium]